MDMDYAKDNQKDDKKGLNLINEYGSRTIVIRLPPIYKYIDPIYQGKLKCNKIVDLGNLWETKIDNRGRVFYVDRSNGLTTFYHPKIKKRLKTKIELDYEQIYGPLPPEWEIIDYYSNELKLTRLLYLNHRLKVTSWIDPRRKI